MAKFNYKKRKQTYMILACAIQMRYIRTSPKKQFEAIWRKMAWPRISITNQTEKVITQNLAPTQEAIPKDAISLLPVRRQEGCQINARSYRPCDSSAMSIWRGNQVEVEQYYAIAPNDEQLLGGCTFLDGVPRKTSGKIPGEQIHENVLQQGIVGA